MDSQFFTFSKIVPDFRILVTEGIHTSEGVSALFVLALLVVFSFFALAVLFRFTQSLWRTRFYLKLLKGITKDNLVEKRREIENTALKHRVYGYLWKEFDETLVYSADGTKLFNTLDAGHFFNVHTLARDFSQSRLLAAVPGFLTAIGVIGTFLGLQLGIAGLDLGSDDNAVLKNGIAEVVRGASIAFMTSIWGVALSVIFNYSEKSLESIVRKQIGKLQDRIDYLFPRVNAEQSLVEISNASKSSDETLKGLAEKIGNKLQEAVHGMTESVQNSMEGSLREVLAPALDKLAATAENLASKQAEGSQKVMEDLVEKYIEGVGQQGRYQKELMDQSTQEVKNAMQSLGEGMGSFLEKLECQLSNLSSEQQTLLEKSNEEINKSILSIKDGLSEFLLGLEEKLNQISADQTIMMEHVEASIEKHVEATSTVLSQGEKLGENVGSLQENFEAVSELMESAAKNLLDAGESFNGATSSVIESASQLSGIIKESTENNMTISRVNERVSELFNGAIQRFDQLKEDHSETTELLRQASEHANGMFNSLKSQQTEYQQAMKDHVGDIAEQVEKLLLEYSNKVNEQVSNRMQAWDEETIKYTQSMHAIVNAMQEVIEDMEAVQS